MDESLEDIIKVEDIETEEEYMTAEKSILPSMLSEYADPLALTEQELSQNVLKRKAR